MINCGIKLKNVVGSSQRGDVVSIEVDRSRAWFKAGDKDHQGVPLAWARCPIE